MVLAVTFSSAIVALHVMAVTVAFGVVFVYPLAHAYVAREHPGALPAFHGLQELVNKRVVAPAGGLGFLFGAYVASDRDLWSETWVSVPALILIVLLGLSGAYFTPRERQLSALAADPSSAEYKALAGQVRMVALGAAGLVLLAIYFMVARPFA